MRIIAQGGLTTHAPSNTMDAILLADQSSCVDGISLDVRMTLDEELLLFTGDVIGDHHIKELNSTDIKKIRMGDKKQKHDIPCLSQLLSCYNGTKMLLLQLHVEEGREESFAKVLANTLFECSHIPTIYLQTNNVNLLNFINELIPDYIKRGFYLYCPNDVNVLAINFFCQSHLTAKLNQSKEIMECGKELIFQTIRTLEEYQTLEKEMGEFLYQISIVTTIPMKIATYEKEKNLAR